MVFYYEQDFVTEECPHCGNEVMVRWDAEQDGHIMHCPFCGEPMMLCSVCPESSCDWTEEHGRKVTRKEVSSCQNDITG